MNTLLIAFLSLCFAPILSLEASSIDWIREYNGFDNDPDRIAAIATNSDGDIIVAGTSTAAGTLDDFVVVKFSPSGDTIWVRRVDNPPANYETCVALEVDGDDNIIVTGTTYSAETHSDFMTAKLSNDGALLWYMVFDGAAHSDDNPSAVVTDPQGNVYVTGSTGTVASWPALEDFVTIKYNKLGEEQWVRFYDGGGESDVARDVEVDSSGNIYVTGNVNTSPAVPGIHCTTIKYFPEGDTAWVRAADDSAPNSYSSGLKIEIDAEQRIYVGGSIVDGFNTRALVVKYNTAGDKLWQRVHLQSSTRWDNLVDMALAPTGGVIITGSGTDIFTARYSASGDTLWSRQWSSGLTVYRKAGALAVNSAGDAFVAGCFGASSDYHQELTLCYSAAGDSLFASVDSMPSYTRSEGIDIVAGADGNIYTGCKIATSTLEDIALMKYNSSGGLVWYQPYSGPGSANDQASAVVVDDLDNSYVVGYSCGLSCDAITIKYSATGTEMWRYIYDGTFHGDDRATAAVLDNSGNLIVVGSVTTASSVSGDALYDYLIIKYNADGDTLWVRTYDGAGTYPSDYATAVVVDAEDNVYVTGSSIGIAEDYVTLKYSPAGSLIWARRYDGSGHGEDHASALALDGLGGLYVTGGSDGGMENDDIVTVKYNTDGTQQWINRYDGPLGSDEDLAGDIAVRPDGLACVTGISLSLTNGDIIVIKYSSAGDTVWTRRVDGPASDWDEGNSLGIDTSGNVYVCGAFGEGSSACASRAQDAVVLKFSSSGNFLWQWKMDNPENCSDVLNKLVLDASGNVSAVGSASYPGPYPWYEYQRMLTVRLTLSGNLVSLDEHEGSASGYAGAVAVALSASSDLLVTGATSGIGSDQDITTIKYHSTGTCGDADGNGIITISDAVYLINYIFSGGPAPDPLWTGDADCNGFISISDAVALINYIFAGGPAPCAACP